MNTTGLKSRQTQDQRTAETTRRIMVAALDVIENEGISRASTTAIAHQAGVSRGALLHHYPSKFNLIAAAVEYLLDQEGDRIEVQSQAVSKGELTIESFLAELWASFRGRLFMITLDYLSVARTNPDLREHLVPISLAFNKRLDSIWEKLFVESSLPGGKATTVLNLSLCLLRGMGVQTILRPNDSEYFDHLLLAWQTVLPDILHSQHPGMTLKKSQRA